jgi:hypothetical protein
LRDPILKITRAKWTGGVAQAVEHLLCKCKALSSNLSATKKKKKKKKPDFLSSGTLTTSLGNMTIKPPLE